MKHILVTGGAGFIGSNLVNKLLLSEKYKVTCMDNFDSFYPVAQKEWNIKDFHQNPNFSFLHGDIRNREDLEQAQNVDTIIHLAAKTDEQSSISDPRLYLDVNINGTQTLLDYAKDFQVKQFIFASCSSVYGANENLPWLEEDVLLPMTPFASTKLSGETMGHVYGHLYGIRFLALRLPEVYGPGQPPERLVHKLFNAILREKPVTVFNDGNPSRDYTFVDDVVQGFMSAIEFNRSHFEIINLGNEETLSDSKLIAAVENILENRGVIERRIGAPSGGLVKRQADISKAQEYLSYDPSTSSDEGLYAFHNWFKKYYNSRPL